MNNRKIIIAAIVLSLLVSCQGGVIYFYDDPDTDVSSSFTTLEEAWKYTAVIEYRSDLEVHGSIDYWQNPSETVERGTGDCEDMAILLMHLADRLGVQSALVLSSNHAAVRIAGNILEPQTYGKYIELDPVVIMSYERAMSLVQ